MRSVILGLGAICLAGAAVAQTASSFSAQVKSDAGSIGRSISDQAQVDRRRSALTTPEAWRPDGEEVDIERAAAWGRCVVRAAPDRGNAYLVSRTVQWRDPAPYRAVFERCRDDVGRFDQDHRPIVLRAAIAEARRSGNRLDTPRS